MGRWIKGISLGLLGLLGLVVVAAFAALMYFHIPQNASGMAAKSVCSAAFVAGRPMDNLLEEDVYGASAVLKGIKVEVNEANHMVTAKFLGLFPRRAVLLRDRGCVLDGDTGRGGGRAYRVSKQSKEPWPQGDAAIPRSDWPEAVDAKALQKAVAAGLVGADDPAAANPRGIAVAQDGKLLVHKYAPGWAPGTPLLGWSMTKTVGAMLAHKTFAGKGLEWDTRVVDAFPDSREPPWVAQWRSDERKEIKLADLLFMRDGLDNSESYEPWGAVIQMLYGEPDMAGWAAGHGAAAPAGTRWKYLSASANILAQVVQAQFDSDRKYWAYPGQALFDPIGAGSATLESDTEGTWVGSSYLWASLGDWTRLGQLTLQDGRWGGTRVLPKGWLELAGTPAMPQGEGHGYGAQVWLPGTPGDGMCAANPGVPEDTIMMEGHWGQVVASVPSRDAVIVRLGWTFDNEQFDGCQLISDVLAALAP